MKEYRIAFCRQAPEWDRIKPLRLEHILWLPDCGIRTEQKICYTEDAIWVYQMAKEAPVRADCTDVLACVCQDSCMEFFFMPEGESRYLNLEWNLNGCLWIGFGTGREDRIRQMIPNPVEYFAFRGERTADGWRISYRIPLKLLRLYYPGFPLEPGQCLRANCYKCGDLTGHPHYLSWNFVTSDTPDFHRPQDFGRMILDGEERL